MTPALRLKIIVIFLLLGGCVNSFSADSNLGPLKAIITKLGPLADRSKADGLNSLTWQSKNSTITVQALGEDVYSLLITVHGQTSAGTLDQALGHMQSLIPSYKWYQQTENPFTQKGATIFRTQDERLECIIILLKDGYYVACVDRQLSLSRKTKTTGNDKLPGTPE
ncbi:MAG: hypothetical protein WCD79_15785 [Chthoniobacteraceae bacterium]